MNGCNVYVIGGFWLLGICASIVAIIGGAVCMHLECLISSDASFLYLWLGLAFLFLLLIVGIYSLYKYRRQQSYVEI